MRELKVEDALLYLDQVKCEFGDQPHIYNEFLDIMKTFKTQQIDTPGVIRRVSNLFRGNRRLVLGFNTFLPEGYKIELPEGDGPAVAVYRAPGSTHGIVLGAGDDIPGGPGTSGGGSGGWSQQSLMHGSQPPSAARPGMPPGGGPRAPPSQPPRETGIGGSSTAISSMHTQVAPPLRGSAAPPVQPHPANLKAPPTSVVSQHSPEPQQPAARRGLQSQQTTSVTGVRQPPATAAAEREAHEEIGGTKPPGPRIGWPHMAQQQSQQQQQQSQQMNGPVVGEMRVPPEYAQPSGARKPPPAPQQQHPPQPTQQAPLASVASTAAPGPTQQSAGSGGNEAQGVVEFDHAINYVTTIKKRFANEPYTYKKFLEILHTYQKEQRGIKEVLEEVSTLFADHPDLLKEFTYFLPDAVQAQAKAQLEQVAKEAEAKKRNKAKQAIMNQAQGMQRQAQIEANRVIAPPLPPPAPPSAAAPPARPAPEYDRSSAPVPFGASQGRSPDHENSIIRSAHFGVVSFAPVRPQKKKTLTPAQAAAKYGRPRTIPELPISPNTSETAFFQRVKEHLNRKELSADRPPGSKRHTPYTEFLKCLHLYGAGILRKDELFLLLKGLFMQGHAPKSGMNASGGSSNPSIAQSASELLREFEDVMIGRGPYADQQAMFKDKSKYGGLSSRDFDFSGCEAPTPSYRMYPSDYPHSLFLSHPGQTEKDSLILNSKVVCVGPNNRTKRVLRSQEEYDAVRIRQNIYEEEMFRIEDERYEVDMAIERNSQAMRQIEPFAEEVQNLREQEEKDGQPIGRLQYQLNRFAMDTIHVNAIGRLYGEKGDEVLQHLLENPLIVLPIVYQRLKQKDIEWRQAKQELVTRWNAGYAANYEGTMDVLCIFKRRALEQRFTKARLLEDCKRAKVFSLHPTKVHSDPACDPFAPSYRLSCPDPAALLFQPHAVVRCKVNVSHKEAFQLVSFRLQRSNVSALDRERIGRIWAEFVVPWFGYPNHWIMDVVRSSFGGTLNPSVVKYALGQRVATQFGEGVVQACMINEGIATYRVKLLFGTAYLSPYAILFAIPSKDLPYVRRDGNMVRDAIVVANGALSAKLHEKYELLFGTEKIYVFVRFYLFLCSLLNDIRDYCETFGCSGDPSRFYRRPVNSRDPEPDISSVQLQYSSLFPSLHKVLLNEMNAKDFETFGRMISKEKIHLISFLPTVIERCAEALLATAKEDCLLQLYDYCHYKQVDPVAVRSHCLAMSPHAMYRIQYDTMSGSMYFNYLPRSVELITMPASTAAANSNNKKHAADVAMEDSEDPIETSDEDGGVTSSRPAKRSKV